MSEFVFSFLALLSRFNAPRDLLVILMCCILFFHIYGLFVSNGWEVCGVGTFICRNEASEATVWTDEDPSSLGCSVHPQRLAYCVMRITFRVPGHLSWMSLSLQEWSWLDYSFLTAFLLQWNNQQKCGFIQGIIF